MNIRKQRKNLNRHTDRGTKLLDESVKRDGWIGAITVAADGETFDGSNRVQVGGEAFADPIIVESDGSKPVVVVRRDIASADDPKAKRLGMTANHIQSVDYDPGAALLRELASEDALIAALAKEDERLRALLAEPTIPDPQPQEEPQLKADCFIEIYCSKDDLVSMNPMLDEWGKRPSVTINIS